MKVKSLGADKGYDTRTLSGFCAGERLSRMWLLKSGVLPSMVERLGIGAIASVSGFAKKLKRSSVG